MEPHSPKSPRFSDTPPGSPKSCMKGSRKISFDNKPTADVGVSSSPVPSPKRSSRGVRMAGEPSPRFEISDGSTQTAQPEKAAPQFQFELTQHYEQSTPPPNCTSNGNYEFEEPPTDDPRKDPQLIEIANKFVNDIIENAKVEAANRQKADEIKTEETPGTANMASRESISEGIRGAGTWLRQARGHVSKWITNICVRAQNIRADLK